MGSSGRNLSVVKITLRGTVYKEVKQRGVDSQGNVGMSFGWDCPMEGGVVRS